VTVGAAGVVGAPIPAEARGCESEATSSPAICLSCADAPGFDPSTRSVTVALPDCSCV
jgi:hypothetical protein